MTIEQSTRKLDPAKIISLTANGDGYIRLATGDRVLRYKVTGWELFDRTMQPIDLLTPGEDYQ